MLTTVYLDGYAALADNLVRGNVTAKPADTVSFFRDLCHVGQQMEGRRGNVDRLMDQPIDLPASSLDLLSNLKQIIGRTKPRVPVSNWHIRERGCLRG